MSKINFIFMNKCTHHSPQKKLSNLQGSLLGLMVGDAIGLPYEGMSPNRINKLIGSPLKHKFLIGKGMVSDDSEHAAITAAALIRTQPNINTISSFSNNLAWRLRWWFLRLPAGVGLATGRAIIKLWFGCTPSKCGVFSAGNGPAMRAPILGVYANEDKELLCKLVKASTELTHRDPKAYYGSLAIAIASALAQNQQKLVHKLYFQQIKPYLTDDNAGTLELKQRLSIVEHALNENWSDDLLIQKLNLEKGVTGYINHTVPVVIYIWLKYNDDHRNAIEKIIRLGGDTDTNAAILGGILGAQSPELIPNEWLSNICDWPISVNYMKQLGDTLEEVTINAKARRVAPLWGPLIFVRNMIFLSIVLLHGFRRLLPPYG